MHLKQSPFINLASDSTIVTNELTRSGVTMPPVAYRRDYTTSAAEGRPVGGRRPPRWIQKMAVEGSKNAVEGSKKCNFEQHVGNCVDLFDQISSREPLKKPGGHLKPHLGH